MNSRPDFWAQKIEVETRYGNIFVPSEIDLISRALMEYGEWAFYEPQFLSQFVSSGTIIFDIGAYLGTFSAGLQKVCASSAPTFLCVEANRSICALLEENMRRAIGPDRANIVNAIVANSLLDLAVEAPVVPFENMGAMSFRYVGESLTDSSYDPELGSLVSLRDLRESHGGHFDILKLDVEGMELSILKSDATWIRNNQPVIWAECNENRGAFDLLDYFWGMSYGVYFFSFPAYNSDNIKSEPPGLFTSEHEAALLAFPGPGVPVIPSMLDSSTAVFQRIESEAHLRNLLWLTPRRGDPDLIGNKRSQLVGLVQRLRSEQKYSEFFSAFDQSV